MGADPFEEHGAGFDLHSGAYGGAAANPTVVLSHLLSQCVSPDGKVLIPDFYDDVAPLTEWEARNIEQLQYDDETLRQEVPPLRSSATRSTASWNACGHARPSR
ncbi:MAG: M20 family dipeptidase [Planctomycetes bacterium]|nr:M20 family dipeptidase [Planctomycetota bacterium]